LQQSLKKAILGGNVFRAFLTKCAKIYTGDSLNMRVVFVGQSGANTGGAERSLQLLLSHLPSRIEVRVILFEDGDYADELRRRGFVVEVVALGLKGMAVQRERLRISALVDVLRMVPRLTSAYRRLSADVIYTNTVKAHILGAIAGRMGGIRVVMHLRDILSDGALKLLRLIAVAFTQRRIAISNAVADALGLPDTVIVPNPIDLSEYENLLDPFSARKELVLPGNLPLVGILGRINRWKGHDRFLRIAKLVSEQSDAHFVIVGKAMFRDEEFLDELHQMTIDLGIADRVHFVPWLDDPRVAYAALDVNCNTSRAEPFGRTIIEAAACGVPTVAFNDGGAPEAIEGGVSGRVVPIDDEPAFAAAILGLLASDRAALADASRAHARLFDANLHAERIAAILDRVVGPKRTRPLKLQRRKRA
jgi:glycosyltransferase involved in cell wall biosynthesis